MYNYKHSWRIDVGDWNGKSFKSEMVQHLHFQPERKRQSSVRNAKIWATCFTDLTDKNALLLICLVNRLETVTPEVASSGGAVLLPVLQAHPTEVKLALWNITEECRDSGDFWKTLFVIWLLSNFSGIFDTQILDPFPMLVVVGERTLLDPSEGASLYHWNSDKWIFQYISITVS